MGLLNPQNPGLGKILAQRFLTDTIPTLVYTVPANFETTIKTFQVVNVGLLPVSFFVFIDPAGGVVFTNANQVLGGLNSNIKTSGSASFDQKSWTIQAGATVAVKAGVLNSLTVTIFGRERRI